MGQGSVATCPECGHVTDPDAKFCSQCGAGLAVSCPVCSTTAAPGAKFCSECGSALRADLRSAAPGGGPAAATTGTPAGPPRIDPSAVAGLSRYLPRELVERLRSRGGDRAVEGERRTVTILFADIQGSTSAAEHLDPEDWTEIVNGAFQHLIAPVQRYGGTLARLQGDAVLAFFGAPAAHEDDPVRAVRAGLEILDEIRPYSVEVNRSWGVPIEVRVGINTGLVVVGDVGSDQRVEYTAIGDAINVAARMEQTADPGTVRVTRETLSLVGRAFEVEDLGAVEVRGKSSSVRAGRVLGFLGEPDTGGEEQTGTRIVGRDAEMARLDDLCSRLRGGSGWIASVIAEAGVGKSRLVSEVHRRADDRVAVAHRFDDPGDVSWLSATSPSYATSPFATVAGALRRWWGCVEEAADEGLVRTAVERAGLDDPDAPALLADLAGIPLSASARTFVSALATPSRHQRVAGALTAYLGALARQRPIVLVLEDLHWADDLSLASVNEIMELTEQLPIGLILTMRPYREDASWGVHEVAERDHHHRYHHIDLRPLGQAESLELLDDLWGAVGAGASDGVRGAILERSDGNPLFITEIVRAAREGADGRALAVPTGLMAVLTARLDRLPGSTKEAAQVASVLGTEFDRDLLGALVPGPSSPTSPAVTDLIRHGVLVESVGLPGVLRFDHALVQEAAYATILRRTRRELHRRVAEHLIETGSGAVGDIAHHLVEAEDVGAALPYLVKAGHRALRSMSLAEAIRLFTLVVESAPDDADDSVLEEAHSGLGDAYTLVPNLSEAEESFQRLYAFGERRARPATRVAALNHLAMTAAWIGGDMDAARGYLEQARELATECGDDLGLAEYHMNACFVESMSGQPDTAVTHDEAAVEIGERSGTAAVRLNGLLRRATNYVTLLDRENAPSAVESALAATRDMHMAEAEAIVIAFGSAMLRFIDGDLRGFLDEAEAAQVVLDRFGSFQSSLNRRNVGIGLYLLGDVEGALANFAECRRTAESLGQGFLVGCAASGMALVYATSGMTAPLPALRHDVDVSLGGALGDFLSSTCRADLGFVDLLTGVPDAAETQFRWGLDGASSSQFTDRPRLLAGLALARVRQGDPESARAAVNDARAYIEEKSYPTYDSLVGLADGEVLLAEGRPDDAERVLAGAHDAAVARGELLARVDILEARARTAAVRGDVARAESRRSELGEAAEAVAGRIVDEELRSGFRARWREVAGSHADQH